MIIDKYKNHPRTIAIKQFCENNFSFCFQFVKKNDIFNEIRSLNATKSSQESDILTKIIKENGLFEDSLHASFNECLES